jgi:hypothetical protein
MRNAMMSFAFRAVIFALTVGHAHAQFGLERYNTDSPFCNDLIPFWLAAAKEASIRNCIRGGPEWTTDAVAQRNFCLKASESERAARTKRMRENMFVCEECAWEVDKIMRSAVDNLLYRCGFTNLDGRWIPKREYHINICVMNAGDLDFPAGTPKASGWFELGRVLGMAKLADEMSDQIAACKLTHPNRNCIACHSSQSPPAARAIPSNKSSLRDALQQSPSRPKLGGAVVKTDPCAPGSAASDSFRCQPTRSKLFNPGLLESGNDLTRPGPSPTGTPVAAPPPVFHSR